MTQVTNSIKGFRLIGTTLATLAAVLVVSTASAAPATEARSVKVSYSDLNLSSEAGTRALYGRIVSAARSVCLAGEIDNRDLRGLALAHQCENAAIAQAVSEVHSERLAALYSSHTARG
jgi:UrcA family protein